MKKDKLIAFLKGVLLVQLFVFITIAGVSVDINKYLMHKIVVAEPEEILLMPFKGIEISQKQAVDLIKEVNIAMSGDTDTVSNYLASFLKPEKILIANLQVLAYASNEELEPDIYNSPTISLPKVRIKEPVSRQNNIREIQDKSVIFYCTHSAETYVRDSGKARVDGERGFVNNVAANMSLRLNDYGLNPTFIDTIHDYPEYSRSYTNSRETLTKALENTNDVVAVFDVHRDSLPGINTATTKTFDGKKSAQILIIVGTDERRPHKNWRENLKFAEQLYHKAEEIYPGLIKGVSSKPGTYNQEFHSRALLLEMGTEFNSYEEANYAGQLFTEVLIEVLKEDI